MQVAPELVEAASRGDPEAFEQIVRQTYRAVYSLVYRILGDSDDAADVTQEVYIRTWKSLRRFRGDANLGTWLYRVATNAALSHARKRGRAGERIATEILEAEPAPEPGPEERVTGEREVERGLRLLPEAQRTVVVLKDMYGWSVKEIAETMGVTEGAVKVRLFRARQRLADALAHAGNVVPLDRRRRGAGR